MGKIFKKVYFGLGLYFCPILTFEEYSLSIILSFLASNVRLLLDTLLFEKTVKIVSNTRGIISIGLPLKPVKNLFVIGRKPIVFEHKQSNLYRWPIQAFISC